MPRMKQKSKFQDNFQKIIPPEIDSLLFIRSKQVTCHPCIYMSKSPIMWDDYILFFGPRSFATYSSCTF